MKHKMTIPLDDEDINWLWGKYGKDWPEKVSEIVHDHISHMTQIEQGQHYTLTQFPQRFPRKDVFK